ncbi:MAG: hypothetical protein MZW92_02430, partial [Comamonadaceae bacterium]|nr:hypothetical protein [Comamonadaceae bacterium]
MAMIIASASGIGKGDGKREKRQLEAGWDRASRMLNIIFASMTVQCCRSAAQNPEVLSIPFVVVCLTLAIRN